jgi:hypothetical protein
MIKTGFFVFQERVRFAYIFQERQQQFVNALAKVSVFYFSFVSVSIHTVPVLITHLEIIKL